MTVNIDVEIDESGKKRLAAIAIALLAGALIVSGVVFFLLDDSDTNAPDNNTTSQQFGPGYDQNEITNVTELLESHNQSVSQYSSYRARIGIVTQLNNETTEQTRRFVRDGSGDVPQVRTFINNERVDAEQYYDFQNNVLLVQSEQNGSVSYNSGPLRQGQEYRFTAVRFLGPRLGGLNTTYVEDSVYNGTDVRVYSITGLSEEALNGTEDADSIQVSGSIQIATEDNSIRTVNLEVVDTDPSQPALTNRVVQQQLVIDRVGATTVSPPEWLETARERTNATPPQP